MTELVRAVKRITLVVDGLNPGGKERIVSHLAISLAEIGFDVTVICMCGQGPFGRALSQGGVSVLDVKSYRSWDVGGLWRLKRLLCALRPDIIHVHDCSSLPYVVLANRLRSSSPIVFTCHGLLFANKRTARISEQIGVKDVRLITAVSPEVAKDYADRLRISRQIQIVENGVPIHRQTAELRGRTRQELQTPDDTFLFIAVGNVKPEKGYEDLLQACYQLRRKAPSPNFLVAVAGGFSNKEYRERLEKQMAQLDLRKTVKFLGYRDDTQGLYCAADAFVLPSKTEGLPMAMLEAMSAGLPVAASAVGGIPRVIKDSVTGLLTRAGDADSLTRAMLKLLLEPDLRERLAGAGADLVARQYSLEHMVSEYLKVYHCAIGRPRFLPQQRQVAAGGKTRIAMLGPAQASTGGMAAVVRNLASSDLSTRCELRVLNTGKTTGQRRPLAVGIISQGILLARLVRELLSGAGDIVHIHTCSGFTFWRDCLHAIAARILGCRIVWHVHGGGFADFAARLNPLGRQLLRFMFERASAVIVLSEYWIGLLQTFAPRAKWRAVPNGVPIPPAGALSTLREPIFLFLGNLGILKGGMDLIRATALAVKTGFRGRVELAGWETEPGQKEAFQKTIDDLGCGCPVQLIGPIAGDAKNRVLSSAGCLVLPSYMEGLPIAILEAMAYGLPIISSRVGAIPEIISEGVEGFLIEPGDVQGLADRMIQLERDAELRLRMGRAARQRAVENYSIGTMSGRLMRIYAEMATRR